MDQWWSWILTAVGVTGLLLAGRKRKAGWAVGFGAQGLWLAYAIATEQWGFIVSVFAYGSVYGRNFLAWRRDEREAEMRAAEVARQGSRAKIAAASAPGEGGTA